MKKSILSLALTFSLTVASLPMAVSAETTKEMTALEVAGYNFYYVDTEGITDADSAIYTVNGEEKTIESLNQIGSTSVYYISVDGAEALPEVFFGTSTLDYTEYYAGDTSVETYDAVSSATTSKYATFPNENISEVREDGYEIFGVKNVPVAVNSVTYVESLILSETDKLPENGVYKEAASVVLNEEAKTEVAQYKTLNSDGTYSSTKNNVVETVTDATLALKTTSVWGDYEIDVIENSTNHLRNSRDDNFDVNSEIQGLILEAEDGTKVGMRYMEEIWVQPYEVAFNLGTVAANKLIGKTVNKVTFVMPNTTYVYEFENGVYVKPQIDAESTFSATFTETLDAISVDLSGVKAELTNPTVSVYYKAGRSTTYYAQNAEIVDGKVVLSSVVEAGLSYTVILESENFADKAISVNVPKEEEDETPSKEQSTTAAAEETTTPVSATKESSTTAAKVEETTTNKAEASTTKVENQTTKKESVSVSVAKVKKVKVKSKKARKVQVSWKKNTKVAGYEIQYSLNKKFKKATKILVKKTKNTKVIGKLKSNKKYYVRIRAYKNVSGKKYYSKWVTAKAVKVK